MEIHPACLHDNEEYIIQRKYNENAIIVYKGIRKVTSIDKINSDGLYEKLHFKNVDVLFQKINIETLPDIKSPELKRAAQVEKEFIDILQEHGGSFDVDDNLKFYDKDTFTIEN
jgi:hypothetical protein